MNKKNPINAICIILLVILAFSMATNTAFASVVNNNAPVVARIWTDKPDYHPGTLVTIYGSGFTSNGYIFLSVTKEKDESVTNLHARADLNGDFVAHYQIDKQGAPLYKIVATDGKTTAETVFTDSMTISTQPISAHIDSGQSATLFSVVAGGNSPYTWQWYDDYGAISGASGSGDTASLTVSTADTGIYVDFTDNSQATIQSDPVGVTVNPALSELLLLRQLLWTMVNPSV